ncbi:MAG: hypothetical protein PUF83_12150, partial [Intestinibaculum porci]|uniref:hypothetical protein n=1 Tax=Intestinibaculum porci TaxID=2487118 RepID=UPI0024099AB3
MNKNIFRFLMSILLGLTLVVGLSIEDAKALTNLAIDIDRDTTINDDVVILQNETVTVKKGYSLTINGNLYVLGNFTNYGEMTISKSLNCLSYNGFMSAGDYSYGQFYNSGRLHVDSLNVTDGWMSSLDTTQLQEFEPADPAADGFVESVNTLPAHYETGSNDAIYAANSDYQDLTNEQKNKAKVAKAYQKLDMLNQEKDKVDQCVALLNALPKATELKLSDRETVQAARQAYNALGELLQKNIDQSSVETLKNDETKLESLATDQSKADDVTNKINALNTDDTTTLKSQYTATLNAYNDLTEAQKKLVSADTLNKLNNAKTKVDELDQQAKENQSKADAVTNKINALNTNDRTTLKSQYT